MSSTYSTTLRIQLIDTNTEFEAWGQPTDNNLGTIIEQAIVGSNTISLTNLTTYTLSTANAAPDQARNAVLVFTGVLNANCNVIAPSVQKVYVVSNQTTNNKSITIKTSGGNGVQIANGTNQLVYCNGTNFKSAVDVNTVIGDLSVSGSSTIGGNVSVGTSVTLGSAITGTSGNLSLISNANVVNFQPNSGALIPPSGSVAQRPATPVLGMGRWNSDYAYYEIWNGTIWQQITGFFNTSYLVVAGGGGGGSNTGGGGGAGGYLAASASFASGTAYTVTVGSGGSAGVQGSSSSISSIATAIGGGAGGVFSGGSGGAGGSGGGGGGSNANLPGAGGAGTSGQGNNGSVGQTGSSTIYNIGGGGGGAAFSTGTPVGGTGNTSSITGTSVYRAAGGGGGGICGMSGTGGGAGAGDGGVGIYCGDPTGTNGGSATANTGSGGGGGGYGYTGGSGGSGVVIISYQSSVAKATGGTITTYISGGTTQYVHTFTSSGTFTTFQELDMPSTYSPSLKIELIANGEQAGTWGQTTNNNLGTLIEQAITGVGQLAITGDYVLTNYNGLADEARNAVLVFSGTLSAPANVIAPSVQKTYVITNNATANVTIKTSGGNGVVVPSGLNSLVYCDGADFYTAVNVNNVIGNLSVSGNETIGGSLTMGGNLTLANTVTGTSGNLSFTANSSVINMGPNTGAFIPPTGTTSARPSSLALGMSRWNTTLGWYEIWTGTTWQAITSGPSYSVNYLVVAGGGGGSNAGGGGGGAGGFITDAATLATTGVYAITVGSGGSTSGSSGTNSSFGSIATAIGGGGGDTGAGYSGGSGGGNGGLGTAGQGNNGGGGVSGAGGGGGGAGAVGTDASGYSSGGSGYSTGGNGGIGIASSISGTSVYYAGGGGGGKSIFLGPGSQGSNGAGGGNTVNRGGGGQGAVVNPGTSPSQGGGSGIVIISYAGAQRGTGGTVTSSGGNTIHTFTSSGTYTA